MASWVQAYNPIKATRGSAFPCQPTCHGSSQVHARRYLTSTLSKDPSFVFTFPCRRGVYKVTRLAALNGLKGGVRTTNLFSFRLVHRRFLLSPQWYTRVWRIRRGFTCRYAQPRFPPGCDQPSIHSWVHTGLNSVFPPPFRGHGLSGFFKKNYKYRNGNGNVRFGKARFKSGGFVHPFCLLSKRTRNRFVFVRLYILRSLSNAIAWITKRRRFRGG